MCLCAIKDFLYRSGGIVKVGEAKVAVVHDTS